jgi:hypothetical protein
MTIKRNVNGIEMEFELTRAERWNTYEEVQHEFDKADIDAVFDREEYGINESEADDLIDEMAYRMRRYMDKYDCDFEYSRDEAIKDVLRNHMMFVVS